MTNRIEQAARALYEDDTGNSADRKQSTLPSSPQRNDPMTNTFTVTGCKKEARRHGWLTGRNRFDDDFCPGCKVAHDINQLRKEEQ